MPNAIRPKYCTALSYQIRKAFSVRHARRRRSLLVSYLRKYVCSMGLLGKSFDRMTLCTIWHLSSPFQSNNMTVVTHDPDFTLCFQYTVLQWIPCLYMVLGAMLYYCCVLNNKRTRSQSPISRFNIFKAVLFLACLSFLGQTKFNIPNLLLGVFVDYGFYYASRLISGD